MPGTALWVVHLSPFVALHLSPVVSSLDAWHGSLGGRVDLSPFVSLLGGRTHLSSVVSQPGCTARTDSVVFFRLASWWTNSFVFRCRPAWMSGTALRADSFICLPLSLHLSPVVFCCLRIDLPPFVSHVSLLVS